MSAVKKFHYIEVLFYIFYYCWGEENNFPHPSNYCSSYQRVCYVEACYILRKFFGDGGKLSLGTFL